MAANLFHRWQSCGFADTILNADFSWPQKNHAELTVWIKLLRAITHLHPNSYRLNISTDGALPTLDPPPGRCEN